MTIKLQGTWEAERIAAILSTCGSDWAHDCANRIYGQVQKEKKARRKDND